MKRVRNVMAGHFDYKIPCCSWMEIAGDINVLASSDKSHPKTLDMYTILPGLMKQEYVLQQYGKVSSLNHFYHLG